VPPARFVAPAAYTPRYLAERILTSRSALEGERKQVTVLFADLKGSMELLAERDPEDARKLLDPVLDRMMEAVHRYEGTVNQVMGDGIMALFGAPLAHEDHAVRACYAALYMQESVTRYGDEVQRSHGVPVQIRIGLNSGDVVVRSIGSDLHMDYTAVGQTTHLAARLEQMAKPGSVLATAETLRLAEGHVQARRLGPVPIKGLPAPVDVFELTGGEPTPARLQPVAPRVLSPFVGRDAELAHLRRALAQAREGRGQVVAVVGEPGVGKTRLLFEFTRAREAEGWRLLETRAVSYGSAMTYFPLITLLKGYFHVEHGEADEVVRDKLVRQVVSLDDRLKDAVPSLLLCLEALPAADPLRSLDPAARQRRIGDAAKRLLLRETQRQPLLLVVENLQWLDPETTGLLDSLIDSLPAARLLLVVTYRPEFAHGWTNKGHYTQLRLDPLPPPSADVLLEALVGSDPALDPLRQLLVRRTEGNPFFLEESLRALVETGVLVGERGAHRLAKALGTIQVPATVRAVLAARIDRLSPEDKRLLQAASVIGADVPFPLLQAVAELSEDELRAGLARLQAAEFLYERTLFPDLEYTFKHALTHEVAYESLLQDQRRRLHARIVEAFETLYPDRLAEQSDWLAHHVVRGEVWAKTPQYLRPVTADPLQAAACWWRGEHNRAVEESLKDLSIGREFKDFSAQVSASFSLGQACHSLGDYPRAIEHLRRNVAALQGDVVRERFGLPGVAGVLSRAWLVSCLAERGDFGEATPLAAEAMAIAEAAGDPYSRVVADLAGAALSVAQGEPAGAIARLERSLALTEEQGIDPLFPLVAALLGHARLASGRVAEAVPLLEEAARRASALGLRANQPLRLAWLGDALLASGQLDLASGVARQALELARAQGERGHEAHVGRLAGDVAHRRTERTTAEAAYRAACALAGELGMRPLQARCHLALGALYGELGRRESARAELDRAAELFRAMAMSAWLARAETARAQLGAGS
jgi:class 3 adenylate cyclase/tetratricopeptide (TPR) repeat protein